MAKFPPFCQENPKGKSPLGCLCHLLICVFVEISGAAARDVGAGRVNGGHQVEGKENKSQCFDVLIKWNLKLR